MSITKPAVDTAVRPKAGMDERAAKKLVTDVYAMRAEISATGRVLSTAKDEFKEALRAELTRKVQTLDGMITRLTQGLRH